MRSMEVCNHNMVDVSKRDLCGVQKKQSDSKFVCTCLFKMNTVPVSEADRTESLSLLSKIFIVIISTETHKNIKEGLSLFLSFSARHAQKYLLSLFSSFSALHSPQRELDGSTGLSGSHLAFCLHLSG